MTEIMASNNNTYKTKKKNQCPFFCLFVKLNKKKPNNIGRIFVFLCFFLLPLTP